MVEIGEEDELTKSLVRGSIFLGSGLVGNEEEDVCQGSHAWCVFGQNKNQNRKRDEEQAMAAEASWLSGSHKGKKKD